MTEPILPADDATNAEEYSTQSDFRITSSDPENDTDDSKGSTRSLKSAPELSLENGRYYCNDSYFMPCDETEQTRLDILYQIYLFLLDHKTTFGAIPSRPKRILELGTGTGDWAMAVAERFPNASIIAVDITSAYFPGAAPPNVTFEVDNVEQPWTYNQPFNYIHVRELGGGVSDWNKLYLDASKHLEIGGSLEVADHSLIRMTKEPENSYLGVYNRALMSAAEKAKTPLGLKHLGKSTFDGTGLSVVKTRTLELPIGQWSDDSKKKIAGKMAFVWAMEGVQAMGLRLLTRYEGYTEESANELMEKVRTEIINPEVKAYVQVQFVVARKMMSFRD